MIFGSGQDRCLVEGLFRLDVKVLRAAQCAHTVGWAVSRLVCPDLHMLPFPPISSSRWMTLPIGENCKLYLR